MFFPNQAIGRADLHRSLEEALQHRLGARLGDLPPPGHLMQRRTRLRHHELWCDELVPAQAGEAHRRVARGDCHRRVNNQDLRQWPLRERWSAATQLSAGVPSSPTRHSSGSSDIGCSSSSIMRRSRSSIACRAPTRRAGRRPDRIHRRTVSGFLPSRSAASATVNMREMVRQASDPRLRARAAYGDQEPPATTNPAHIDASADQRPASTYHPLATRTNRGDGPENVGSQGTLDGAPRHRLPHHCFDCCMDLPSPHRLPPATQDLDQSIYHPARPSPSKPLARTTRGGAPLARTAASFSVNRANDSCRSWFDRTPIRSISPDIRALVQTHMACAHHTDVRESPSLPTLDMPAR